MTVNRRSFCRCYNATDHKLNMANYITPVFADRRIQLIILGVAMLLLRIWLIGSPVPASDTYTYLDSIEFIESGTEAEDPRYLTRILTSPLFLASGYFIGAIFDSTAYGFLFVSLIFFILSIPVFYHLALAIFSDKRIATIASIIFVTNYNFYRFGVEFLADMPGWFFMLLSSLFAVYYYQDRNTKKYFYLAITAAAIGVFFKEYGALGMFTLGMVTLFSAKTWFLRFKEWFIAGAIFSIILIAYHLIIFLTLHYSYFDWWLSNTESAAPTMYNLETLIKVLGWLFLAGWPLILMSGIRETKVFFQKGLQDYHLLLICFIPMAISFLAWPGFLQRVGFVMVPLLALVATLWLSDIKRTSLIVLILFTYAAINLSTEWLMTVVNI